MSLSSPVRLCDVLPHKIKRPEPASSVYGADRLEVFERLTTMLYASTDATSANDATFDSSFSLNPNLRDTFLDFCQSRLTLLYGGRGSSKSF